MLIKKLLSAVTLYNRDRNGINDLVGRKSSSALDALAAALNARAIINGARIKDSRILKITNGTFHKRDLPFSRAREYARAWVK